MAASDNAMQIVFQASIGDVLNATKQLEASLSQLAKTAKEGLGGELPQATRAATEAHGGLVDKLRELTAEQRSQGRMVAYWVRDVNEIAGASRAAQSAFSGLGAAAIELAAGFTPMAIAFAAFEAIKGIAGYFHEMGKEAEEAAKKVQEAMAKAGDAIFKLRAELSGINPERALLQGQIAGIDSILKRLDDMKKRWQELNDAIGSGATANLSLMGERDRLTRQIEETEKLVTEGGLRGRRALLGQQLSLEVAVELQKDWQAEMDARLKAAKLEPIEVPVIWDVLPQGDVSEFGIMESYGYKGLESKGMPLPPMSEKPLWDFNKALGGQDNELKGIIEQMKAPMKEIERMAKHTADAIASAFSDAFVGLVMGTKRIDQAMRELFASILQAFVDMIAKMIAEALASAILMAILDIFTGGAASAAGAAFNFAGAASGGGGLSLGVPGLSMGNLKAGPMPVLGSIQEIGSGPAFATAGSNVTVNIQAMDGPSVYRTLRENETHLVRVIREASANGRL